MLNCSNHSVKNQPVQTVKAPVVSIFVNTQPLVKTTLLFLCLIMSGNIAFGQTSYLQPDTRPLVIVGADTLKFPWTGGVNSPIVNEVDINGDGKNDILLFDRVGGRLTTFINDGILNVSSYTYAPEYQVLFPPVHDWLRTADYDCDGDMDIFTYTNAAIGVWRNDYSASSGLLFTPVTQQLNSLYDTISANIFVTQVNLPAFIDVDGDSDLDIITFTSSGNFLEYHENYSFDSTGICGGFNFKIDPDCWGNFKLSGLSNSALLNESCTTLNNSPDHLHAGSVLVAFDQSCDGDIDLLNGDILGENMLFLENGGTQDSASIVSQDSLFPVYDISVNMQNLPGPHYLDINNDGKRDLIITPFATVGEDFNNMHLYRNTSDNCSNIFQRVNLRFLAEDMIDVGTASNVAFADVNGDGLQDIVAGNDLFYNPDPLLSVSRLVYFVNSGTAALPQFTLTNSDFLNTSQLLQLGLAPAFGDLDGDGDQDMLLGNADGKLIFYRNTASPGSPMNLVFTQAFYQGIDIGNNSAPQIIDVDRDGLVDLLIGERAGNLNYFHNTGSASTPVFTFVTNTFGGVSVLQPGAIAGYSAPLLYDSAGVYRMLVGSDAGTIYLFDNIDGNLTGTFTTTDTAYNGIVELKRVTIARTDIDADGKSDLLAGCNAGGMRLYTHYASSGISDAPDPLFRIYPNPATDQIWLQFKDVAGQQREITVVDITGKIVFHATNRDIYASVNVSSFTSGLYLIRVVEGQKSFIQKLVVRH